MHSPAVAAVILDQILDHALWIDADFLCSKSTSRLWEEACEFVFLKIKTVSVGM